jgi:hypothetical protein
VPSGVDCDRRRGRDLAERKMNGEGCGSTQLIDGDGEFNVEGLERFIKEVKLADCGLSYAIVSIMGPQSSGMVLNFAFYPFICVESSECS